MPSLLARLLLLALALLASSAGAQPAIPEATGLAARVDALFAPWSRPDGPGCSVGVARQGEVLLTRGYGLAHLELGVPNTPETVFEAGSVSKQFTAAAVLLLARQGRLSLDAPVRTWLPELSWPSGAVTLRQLLGHTSGLRDWGTVVEAAGWPRGSRVHTHAHVLEVVRRQRALNFPAGTQWLYSNSGYNLAALIVERVSGQSLQAFMREQVFAPLGMERTRWRDNHAEVVKGRATAYASREGTWQADMPFENVYGNGGLLTTVGELLRWNENFTTGRVGGEELVRALQERGRLADGRELGYAAGLFVGHFRGVPEVSHSGATGGYRAFLARYPEQHLSVALLCNAAEVRPDVLARQVAELFLGDALQPPPPPAALSPEELARRAGLYLNTRTREPMRVEATEGGLRAEGLGELVPLSATLFQAPKRRVLFELGEDGRPRALQVEGADGDPVRFTPLADGAVPALTPALLARYRGSFHSDEAEVTYTVSVEGEALVLSRRPDARFVLEPLPTADLFRAPELGLVTFLRDKARRVRGLSLDMGRVRALRFVRTGR